MKSIYLGLDKDYISIYDAAGNLVASNKFRQKTSLDPENIESVNMASRKMLWNCGKDDLGRFIVSLVTPIIGITGENTSKNIGFARMDIDYAYIAELFLELKSDNNSIFLSDSNGNILLVNKQSISGETLNIPFSGTSGSKLISSSNRKFLFHYKKLGNSPWYLISKYNYLDIARQSSFIFASNIYFLYNTLDTTIYMVKEGYKDNAIAMIKALSNLFRYGLSRGEIIISIREEIEYAKSYANIINLRYKNKIEFKWNIDEKILDYKTVKLILQPVIENSIYHGVNKVERHGVIEISCIDAGENIEYRVKDNGAGISEDALQLLRKSLSEPGLGNRIGIYNVQSRLRLYFGKRFGLAIQSKKGEGTEVTITIHKIADTLTG